MTPLISPSKARARELAALRMMTERVFEQLKDMQLSEAAQAADRLCGEIAAAEEAHVVNEQAAAQVAARSDPRLRAPVGSA